jgi:hypothetical protein
VLSLLTTTRDRHLRTFFGQPAVADREGKHRCADGRQAGGGECLPVVAEPDPEYTGTVRRDGGTDLMPKEDPNMCRYTY